ncbi:phosphotransferase enzyme family protein [Ktedonospora formicarum]|nr:phosphotransferase [Ktedonospora formicarum]
MLALSDLRRAWNLSPILSTWTPETGTIHRILLLKTIEGSYALRAYRYTPDECWRISCEHALIAYAQTHGLPVLSPLPLSNGESILEQEGHFYALFPIAPGQQIARGDLTLHEIMVMGRFLGELHQILVNYSHERVPHRSFTIDRTKTPATIDTIEKVIRSQPPGNGEDSQALSRLAERRAWLATTPSVNLEDLSSLEQQVIHGDYQETNLFFEDGQVSAVIDWDQSYVAPRAWEVVRTLHYVCKLEKNACRTFLEAYRCILPLTSTELEVAAAAYGWVRAHDLWHYQAIYLKGISGCEPFCSQGHFFLLRSDGLRFTISYLLARVHSILCRQTDEPKGKLLVQTQEGRSMRRYN